jgi:hypothetical protein
VTFGPDGWGIRRPDNLMRKRIRTARRRIRIMRAITPAQADQDGTPALRVNDGSAGLVNKERGKPKASNNRWTLPGLRCDSLVLQAGILGDEIVVRFGVRWISNDAPFNRANFHALLAVERAYALGAQGRIDDEPRITARNRGVWTLRFARAT